MGPVTGHLRDVSAEDRYRDERNGFSLVVPDGWEVQRGIAGLLVAVVKGAGDGSFRPNLNVVRKVRDRVGDLDDLARETVRGLGRLLSDFLLIDLDGAVVSNLPARRVLMAYRQGIFSVTSEQWIVLTDQHIWTLSAAAPTDRWDECADVFAAVASSWVIGS